MGCRMVGGEAQVHEKAFLVKPTQMVGGVCEVGLRVCICWIWSVGDRCVLMPLPIVG